MIAEVLPKEFVEYMGVCEDQAVIRRFSGKTLLRIAGLESPKHLQLSLFYCILLKPVEVSLRQMQPCFLS